MANNIINWNEQQSDVINYLDDDLVVSASAGSGKSAVMLERVMKILNRQVPLSKIVLLAYNVAIAAELKQKLSNKLTQEIAAEGINASHLAEALDEIDKSYICTMDSFCSRIIKEFFQELNIDPNFTIMDPTEQKSVLYSIINERYNLYKETVGESAYRLADKFGGERGIYDIIQGIISFLSSLPDPDKWINETAYFACGNTLESSGIVKALFQLLKKRSAQLVKEASADYSLIISIDKWRDSYSDMMIILKGILHCDSYAELHDFTQSMIIPIKVRKAPKADVNYMDIRDKYDKYYDAIKEFANDVKELVSLNQNDAERQLAEGRQIISQLMHLTVEVRDNYQKYKLENSKFEFSDLSYYAIQLLKDDNIANVLRERFSFICIDEFQDADYRQEYILSRISHNNLFIVGDGKQSIYKFRMAEPQILAAKFSDIITGVRGGKAVRLNSNYRSDERVLNYVNEVFNVIMEDAFSGVNYAQDERLVAGAKYEHRDNMPSAVESYIEQSGKDNKKESNKEVIEFFESNAVYDITADNSYSVESEWVVQEAEYIYRKIKDMVNTYDIYDISTKIWRKVHYGDIAILSRERSSNVAFILRYLKIRGLPIDDANLVKETSGDAIDSIINIMKCVDNYKNDIVISAALISHIGRFDYEELANVRKRHRDKEFFYQACESDANGNDKMAEFFNRLEILRSALAIEGIFGLVHHIVYGYGMEEYLYNRGNGDCDVFLIEQFLAELQGLGLSLHDYIDVQEKSKGHDYEKYRAGYADKLIQTSTIHSAKGLEYSVVFLIDCDRPLKKNRGTDQLENNINISKNYGMIVSGYDDLNMLRYDSLAAKIIKEVKRDEDLLEYMRLLYVAMTRAKNHLYIVSGAPKGLRTLPYKVNCFAEWINNAAQQSAEVQASIIKGKAYADESIAALSDSTEQHIVDNIGINEQPLRSDEILQYLDYKYPYADALNIGIKYTVTEINNDFSYEDQLCKERPATDENDNFRGDKRIRGTNYHKILEHIDYDCDTVDKVVVALDNMVTKGIITQEDSTSVNVAEIARVLAMPIMRRIAYWRQMREKQFMLCLPAREVLEGVSSEESILIQGAIDLIADGEELILIDFKKSAKSSDNIIRSYGKQMWLYSIAVREAVGRIPDKILIIEIGRAMEVYFN